MIECNVKTGCIDVLPCKMAEKTFKMELRVSYARALIFSPVRTGPGGVGTAR